MSRVVNARKDRGCILCLTPRRGGTWHSRLKVGGMWPAAAPRNFADEPATWYDFAISSARIGTHDYTRELIVRINDTDGIIWGDTAWQSVFYAVRSGQSVLLCMQPGTANYARVTIPSVAAGIHTITWRKTGNSASYSFDGSELFSVPAVTGNTQWTTRAIPRSTTGTILSDTLRDETSGRTVWNYPNEAERGRLIAKTNARTDRGFFEAADASLGWSIKTAVPASTAGTVLAKISGMTVANPSRWNRSTATFTGAVSDKLEWLLVFDRTLTVAEIAALSK